MILGKKKESINSKTEFLDFRASKEFKCINLSKTAVDKKYISRRYCLFFYEKKISRKKYKKLKRMKDTI